MKKVYVVVVVCVVAGVATMVAVATRNAVRTDPSVARAVGAAMPVQTAPAESRELSEVVGGNALVESAVTIEVKPRVSMPVAKVHASVGQLVRQGQLLLALNADRAREEAELARRKLSLARVEINKAADTRAALEAALALAKTKVEGPRVDLKAAQEYEARLRPAAASGVVAQSELEAAVAKTKRAEAALATAEAEVRSAEMALRAAESAAKEAEEQVAVAEGAWQAAVLEQSYATVRSPAAGIVISRAAEVGELVSPLTAVFTIGQISSVYAVVTVSEERFGSVKVGETAEVTFDAFPNTTMHGRVERIDPSLDSERRVLYARIKLENPRLKLRPGMTGFAVLRHTRRVLAVPSVALVNPVGDRATVFAVDKSRRVHLKQVLAGVIGDGYTEIVSGLSPGEEVVVAGQSSLKDNDPVERRAQDD
jgi:multidrug efflux pump subunit AcrA (membrane-fusion protein)